MRPDAAASLAGGQAIGRAATGRLTRARGRRLAGLIGSGAVAISVVACIGGPGTAGSAQIRNESAGPIRVEIDEPARGLLGGTAHVSLDVPPWQAGWCPALGYGLTPGSVTISVRGASVSQPASRTFTVTEDPSTGVLVEVNGSGAARIEPGASPPPETTPCQGYPLALSSASP